MPKAIENFLFHFPEIEEFIFLHHNICVLLAKLCKDAVHYK